MPLALSPSLMSEYVGEWWKQNIYITTAGYKKMDNKYLRYDRHATPMSNASNKVESQLCLTKHHEI